VSLRRLASIARDPVDAASTGVFRIIVGVLMLGEVGRWLGRGWIEDEFLTPAFLFKYHWFEWVAPASGAGLHLLFVALGVFAALVAVGLCYRVAVVGMFLTFGYIFLLNQATYLNQYYLLLLVAMLLCLVPADREYSVRARRTPSSQLVVPRWSVWVLRLQFEVVLVFAGLVKLNADWLAGQPLGIWFAQGNARLSSVATWLSVPGAVTAVSYAVVLLHLLGAPLLLWRRTRLAVFVVYIVFHLTNSVLLKIGLFPWLTVAGTLMFFDPDWPRVIARRLGFAGSSAPPLIAPGVTTIDTKPWVWGFLAAFFLVQLLVPLRYLLYPGNVAWTNEGHMFAWRMKLDDRRGTARFVVRDPVTGRTWEVDPYDYLPTQQAERLATNPDMILQFAHYLEKASHQDRAVPNVEVRAIVMCSLNGRESALLIDPDRDLTQVRRTWRHYDWILPLRTPLVAASEGHR